MSSVNLSNPGQVNQGDQAFLVSQQLIKTSQSLMGNAPHNEFMSSHSASADLTTMPIHINFHDAIASFGSVNLNNNTNFGDIGSLFKLGNAFNTDLSHAIEGLGPAVMRQGPEGLAFESADISNLGIDKQANIPGGNVSSSIFSNPGH